MKVLSVFTDEYIDFALGYDDYRDAVSLADWFLKILKDKGKIELSVEDNFNVRDTIPLHLIDTNSVEGLEEFIEDEFDGEAPLKFEFKGETYILKLDR